MTHKVIEQIIQAQGSIEFHPVKNDDSIIIVKIKNLRSGKKMETMFQKRNVFDKDHLLDTIILELANQVDLEVSVNGYYREIRKLKST